MGKTEHTGLGRSETSLSVRCPKCGADVPVPTEWQTPTIPPMVPNIPTLLLLGQIGHECDLADIVKLLDWQSDPRQGRGHW